MINQISIVIPALNEEESIPSLVDELNAELESTNLEFEIIIVDDGSITSLKKIISNPRVQVLENSFNRGQSFSILKGIEHSSYEYIVTLDGDGQNPPSEIIKLVDGFVNTARYSLSKLSFIFGAISALLFAISFYQKIINLVFVHRNPLFIIGIVFFIIFLQLFTFSLISFFLENKKND